MILQSAIRSLWIPFAETHTKFGEDRIRWVACLFMARLQTFGVQPVWLTVDWLLQAWEEWMEQEAELAY